MQRKAVVYCRISDDRTGLAAGVSRQEQDARALCARRDWEVSEVVVDNDLSASTYSRRRRPGWARVLEMIKAGDVDVIAGYHTDRMYRRPSELEQLIELAESTLIATVEGDFRLDTSDGRAMARVIAAMSAKESDDKSRRIRRKHEELAELGQVPGGGRRPFGYDDDRVTVRHDEAALIVEAAQRLIAGESLRSVVADWRARGVATVTGTHWSATTLRRLVTSGRVAGLRTHKGAVTADAVWPAILDRPTWNAVRHVLEAPRGLPAPTARVNLLTGLVVCAACDGVAMSGRPVKRKGISYRRYHCAKDRGGCDRVGIAAEPLEDLVVDAILARLTASGGTGQAPRIESGDVTAQALAAAEADLDGLAVDLADGRIGRSAFAAASTAIEARLVDLRRALIRERSRGEAASVAAAADPAAAFEELPFDRRLAVLAQTIEAVHIAPTEPRVNYFDPGRVSITWR